MIMLMSNGVRHRERERDIYRDLSLSLSHIYIDIITCKLERVSSVFAEVALCRVCFFFMSFLISLYTNLERTPRPLHFL